MVFKLKKEDLYIKDYKNIPVDKQLDHIVYNDNKHIYFNKNTGERYTSVTTLIHMYANEFDTDKWSKYKAIERFVTSKQPEDNKKAYFNQYKKQAGGYDNVISYFENTIIQGNEKRMTFFKKLQQDILDEWKETNKKSLIKGSEYHKKKENYYLERCEAYYNSVLYTVCTDNNMANGVKYAIYPELLIYNDEFKIAGQADLIIRSENELTVRDYKTNRELKMNNPFQKMLYPLSSVDDCVAGDTKLITKKGLEIIEDCVDKEIEIWNGQNWSLVKPFKTGDARELYRITFSDGSYLDVTDNHEFLIKHRLDKDFAPMKTKEIINMFNTTKWLLRVPRANIDYNSDGITEELAYEYGFILGDGTVDRGIYVKAELHGKKQLLNFKNVKSEFNNIKNGKEFKTVYFDVDAEFCSRLKYDTGLPREIFSWDKKSILSFIAGWFDADGSLGNKGFVISGREDKLRDLQLLFTKCNINSSCYLTIKAGSVNNYGIRKNDLYQMTISKTVNIPTQRLKQINLKESTKKGKYQIIKNIEKLDGLHKTYCLTENEFHQCVFNNVLTKQCSFNHYQLQLSLYAYMLVHNYGVDVKSLIIDHHTDEGDISYPCEYMFDFVESILHDYKKKYDKLLTSDVV